jgi:hypothetical protein
MSKVARTHLTEIKITDTDEHVCDDCIKVGDSWLHLRCVSLADTSTAAIRPRIGTRESTSTELDIR